MVVSEVRHDVDKLLEIPEIEQAMKRYQEITDEHRQAVLTAVRNAPGDELPDVEEIKAAYDARLRRNRGATCQSDVSSKSAWLMDELVWRIAATVVGGLIVAGSLGAIGWAYRNHRTLARHDRQIKKLTSIIKTLAESTSPEQGKKILIDWLDED